MNDMDEASQVSGLFARLRGLAGRILVPLAAVLGIPLIGQLMPRCDGGYPVALEAINQCPAATDLLGTPVHQAWVGFACGESESSCNSGQSEWQMRVAGPERGGTYRYAAANTGSGWFVQRAELVVGGETYDVVPCPGGQVRAEAGPTATPGYHDPVRFGSEHQGRVVGVFGDQPVAIGDRCAVTLSPSPEEARRAGYNCHVKVRCAATVLYGWEGAGITRCRVADGIAVTASDEEGASRRDDPLLEVDVEAGTAAVADDPDEGPWRVEIELEAGRSPRLPAPRGGGR